jgi:ubiquinone/menaquinone biosynthesis C-methylase UbiE
MNDNIKIVSDWYKTEKSYEYMPEATKSGLKIWEKNVISKYFSRDSRILDIGCGMGREAFALYDMGFTVTGVDISEPIITKAKQLAVESKRAIKFILSNGLNIPFENDIFDIVIVWSQTFGLFYGEENQIHILQECKRVLKKGGILSFSGHDREFQQTNYAQYLKGNKFYAYAYTDCYWESFTIDEILERVKKAGFDSATCERGLNYKEEDGTILHCECRK